MTNKYVYLYKITLTKADERPLYYYGIRVCKVLPSDDPYMGSPKTFKQLWKDDSYVKSKEILEVGNYDLDYDKFREKEPDLIKECWNQYGVYIDGGQSLNIRAGLIIHKKFMIGENNPSKRKDVRDKLSYIKKTLYENTPLPFHTLEAKKKAADARKRYYEQEGVENPLVKYMRENPDKNPSKNPEINKRKSRKMKEYYSDPENLKRLSERSQRWHDNNNVSEETRKKMSESLTKRFANPNLRKKISDNRKEWHKNNTISDETRRKLSEAGKARFARGEPNPMSNPEISAKAWATRKKNAEAKRRLLQQQLLGEHLD